MLLFFSFMLGLLTPSPQAALSPLAGGACYAAQNIKIEIPEVIYNTSSTFKLGQVAKISGGNQGTRRILSALTLYPDGDKLSRREVLRAIEDSDAADARIELYMPMYSQIEAPGYEGNFTETSEPPQKKSRSLSDLIPAIKNLAAWNGGLEISANAPVPDGKIIDPASIVPGSGSVTLRFQDEDGKIKSLPVRLNWTQNAMIAAHNIRKGDKIEAHDLYSRPIKITRPGMYASSPSEIEGYTANRNIQQGEPVLLNSVTSSNLLKRGRQVKIIARIGAATATVDGVLLEDGRPGEWVKVRRVDDRKIILRARIINENTVEVNVE